MRYSRQRLTGGPPGAGRGSENCGRGLVRRSDFGKLSRAETRAQLVSIVGSAIGRPPRKPDYGRSTVAAAKTVTIRSGSLTRYNTRSGKTQSTRSWLRTRLPFLSGSTANSRSITLAALVTAWRSFETSHSRANRLRAAGCQTTVYRVIPAPACGGNWAPPP